jgi:hypothetical protein
LNKNYLALQVGGDAVGQLLTDHKKKLKMLKSQNVKAGWIK